VALPEVDGFGLCRRIRSDARFGSLRFIFLSAKNNREAEIEGLALGADDYITKPFDVDKLIARVEARLRWLDTAKAGPACEGSMEGNLSGRNLIDILQILEIGQRTGQLQISCKEEEVLIKLSNGTVVGASSKQATGNDAVFAALALPIGRFCFTPLEDIEGDTHLEITRLLMQWALLADEMERDQPHQEGVEDKSHSTDVVNDFIRYVKERKKEKQ
jgi:DNA-binding response OmpR family regulator